MRKREFYLACFRRAVKGVWGVTGDISTTLGVVIAAFWHFRPDLVNDPLVIARVNDWGGIWLLLIPAAALSAVRLWLAPYWIYKEAQDKIDAYKREPLEIKFIENAKELITIRIINQTEKVQRLANAYLKLVDAAGEQGMFNRVFRHVRFDSFPHVLESDDSIEVEFETFLSELQLGRVASFSAEVELANGRIIHSDIVRLPSPLSDTAMLPGSLKDRLDRSNRIKDFVANVKYLFYQYEDVRAARTLFRFEEAEVRQLADDSEVREACANLTEQGIPHAFSPWDLAPATNAEGVNILEFYKTIKREGMDLSQSKGDIYFQVWRQQQLHLSRQLDKDTKQISEPLPPKDSEADHSSELE